MIRYNVMRMGDIVLTQVDHPQAPAFEARNKVVPIKGGFEFRPPDESAGDSNVFRYQIVDDSTMKLVYPAEAAEQDIVRMRCAPAK